MENKFDEYNKQLKRILQYRWAIVIERIALYACIITLSIVVYDKLMTKQFIFHKPKTEIQPQLLKPYSHFVNKVIDVESGGVMDTISEYGMLGGFQFNPSTLRYIGYTGDIEYFLNNRDMQVAFFKKFLLGNKKLFQKYIDEYNGKRVNGINCVLTESGIIMMFHLKPKDAKAFFDSNCTNIGSGDGNGTTVCRYGEIFSGYSMPH